MDPSSISKIELKGENEEVDTYYVGLKMTDGTINHAIMNKLSLLKLLAETRKKSERSTEKKEVNFRMIVQECCV
jgi:hypothetical protein